MLKNEFFELVKKNSNIDFSEVQKKVILKKEGATLVIGVSGAGKTKLILARLAMLILVNEVKPEEILNLTFNDSTARDMQEGFNEIFHPYPVEGTLFLTFGDLEDIIIKEYEKVYKSSVSKATLKKDHSINNDVTVFCFDILKSNSIILDKLREKYKYIQLDEAQDTSIEQQNIIKLLAGPKNNILITANDDESIYVLKGAYPEFIMAFSENYEGGEIVTLEESFRGNQLILESAHKFISINKKRYPKIAFTKKEEGDKIKIIEVFDSNKKLEYISELLKDKEDLSDCAIFFRNDITMLPFVDYLQKKGIQFSVRGFDNKFFDNPITTDILEFFKLAVDNSDLEAFKGIYEKANCYLNMDIINALESNFIQGRSVFEQVLGIEALTEFERINILRIREGFEELSKKMPYDGIEFINTSLGYYDYCSSNSSINQYFIDLLFTSIKGIAFDYKTLRDFIGRIKELKVLMSTGNNKNGITLSTLHSSKGLEFDSVIITDLIQGLLPSAVSIEESKNEDFDLIEEERRLLYVGMTRAKKELRLVVTKFECGNSMEASQFIDEIMSVSSVDYYRESDNRKGNTRKNNEMVKYVAIGSVDGLTEIAYNKFKIDTLVEHKKFGKGRILSESDCNVTVEFLNYGVKTFDKKLCIEKNLLMLINC